MTMTSVVNKLLDEMGAFVLPVAAGLFIGGFLLNRMTAVEDSEDTEETEVTRKSRRLTSSQPVRLPSRAIGEPFHGFPPSVTSWQDRPSDRPSITPFPWDRALRAPIPSTLTGPLTVTLS